ncbi:CapA family protein [Oceanobacillus kimchii]|uniref:CapA family protein n=1 Tax=Oceanobacillus kimchii TaxID=746691 RepID=UPI003B023D5B
MTKEKRKITLAATGDVLLHSRVYNKAESESGYDFTEMLSEAKLLFEKGDLTIVNQESIIGGTSMGLSDYPKFNSPVEIGYTLKEFGVDIVNLANNHVLDKGEEGVIKSLHNWNKIGLPYVGAYNSQEDKDTVRIFHKNGLRVAFVSCTKRMRGVTIPKKKKYLVDSFEDARVFNIANRIKQIRANKLADVVVLSIHYGKEYQMLPTADQVEMSNKLSDAGADIILGHHPHVLQPPTYILNSQGKETFCIYSLGNFFSGQFGLFRQIGGYLTIDIEKPSEDDEVLKIDNPTLKLTYVDATDEGNYKLHLLEDIVQRQEYIRTRKGRFNSAETYEKIKNHMRKWIPDLDIS